MSILEPRSDDQTAMTSPTWDSRIARMSSRRGRGRKLPRASVVRVMAGVEGVSSMSLTSLPMCFSDEDDGAATGGQVEGGHALDSVHEGIEVAGLEVQEVHGERAGLDIDPAQLLGLTQGLGPAGAPAGGAGEPVADLAALALGLDDAGRAHHGEMLRHVRLAQAHLGGQPGDLTGAGGGGGG